MPAERPKKSRVPAVVPGLEDPDRKRVLNVLAQRRYRQRRREKMAALEAQANGHAANPEFQQQQVTPQELDMVAHNFLPDVEGEDSMIYGEMNGRFDETYAMFTFDQDAPNGNLMQDFQAFPGLLSPHSSTPSSSSPQFPLTPDGAVLSVPVFSTIRAFANIALAFEVVLQLWDPSHLHVLPSAISPAVASLPANLHPIPAQFTIPHHPVLDLLPWPSVREKLICVLSLPSAFRPPVAQEDDAGNSEDSPIATAATNTASPIPGQAAYGLVKQSKAIVQLVHDLDEVQDGKGLRVHGNTTTWSEGNELTEESWEIGDVFYRKWWWCLDQKVVDTSNRRRMDRGLPRLRLTA